MDAWPATWTSCGPSCRLARALSSLRLRRRLVTGPAPFGVSVHASLLDAGVVAELHDRVERVLTWPVNDQDALEAVLGYGVSGVISDDAGILAQVVARRDRGHEDCSSHHRSTRRHRSVAQRLGPGSSIANQDRPAYPRCHGHRPSASRRRRIDVDRVCEPLVRRCPDGGEVLQPAQHVEVPLRREGESGERLIHDVARPM